MARLIVTSDNDRGQILMDETVRPVHLEDPHSSLQIIERMAWAVEDAERHSPVRAIRSAVGRAFD